MVTKYIGGDVHVATTDLAVERNARIVARYTVPTNIPSLRAVLSQIANPKVLAIEEGCMSGWLYRNLRENVDQMIVCDPRRNLYIAQDGDKDDPIDSAKLAELARGGYLREVYHTFDEDRVVFKEWIGIYHDRVRERTRQTNKMYALARARGVQLPASALKAGNLDEWMAAVDDEHLPKQLELLRMGYDTVCLQVQQARREVCKRRKKYPIIGYWEELPGVGVVRASTMLAYLDTPWRFHKANRLWKYCGLGLQRSSSGRDRSGRPKKGKLQLAWQVNRRLKDAIVGATTNAIVGDNPFALQYRRLLNESITPGNAKHTVARKLLTVMWSMWKHNERFDPKLL